MIEQKKNLRKKIKFKLNELSSQYKESASEKILTTLESKYFSYSQSEKIINVLFFYGMSDEPKVFQKFQQSLKNNKNLNIRSFLPKIDVESNTINAYSTDKLKKHPKYDFLEPDSNFCKKIDANNLYVLLIPSLAFCSKTFVRLGRGGGYYDKFLDKVSSKLLKIGICFDFQIIDYKNLNITFPHESHDKSVDLIISEKRVLT